MDITGIDNEEDNLAEKALIYFDALQRLNSNVLYNHKYDKKTYIISSISKDNRYVVVSDGHGATKLHMTKQDIVDKMIKEHAYFKGLSKARQLYISDRITSSDLLSIDEIDSMDGFHKELCNIEKILLEKLDKIDGQLIELEYRPVEYDTRVKVRINNEVSWLTAAYVINRL